MKQILIIAANTYRLIFRRGTGWGILATAVGISLFIFSQAQADGVLVNELRLRMRYAASFSIVFLSISMLFVACLSIRRDIDLKLMHVLTSYPLPRYRIWFGKWLGCLAFSWVGLLSIGIAIAACMGVLRQHHEGPRLDDGAVKHFWQAYRLLSPDIPSLDELVDEEYARRRRQGETVAADSEWRVRSDIRDEIRREEQLVAPNGARSWEFSLGDAPLGDPEILLEYCFFARDRRQRVSGSWRIEPIDAPGRFAVTADAFPYTTQRLRLPARIVPPSGRVRITFSGKSSPHLIFARGKGPFVLVRDGNLLTNAAKSLPFLVLHFGAVIAVGLALAVPLTLPVASFACLVMYLVAVAATFFEGIAQDVVIGEPSVVKIFLQQFIWGGVWLSQGLRMPPVLAPLSDGISIDVPRLLTTWGAGFAIFLVAVSCLGLFWLSRKEIDRLH